MISSFQALRQARAPERARTCDRRITADFRADSLATMPPTPRRGVGGTVDSEPALKPAGTLSSQIRALIPPHWPDGGPESLGPLCCGQIIKALNSLKHHNV
ncbi:hypothetical protein PoB_002865800 [Plakobranchus ocellatus]|uniref:Uncharacterized protein n=1 Tax=Plakobranchus ocellatus TaxID=259542 RepID=A0AAV4A4M5_9GAST|nr:hypothetical protein PoB_002865800 [Plakobranchus ocellatus]